MSGVVKGIGKVFKKVGKVVKKVAPFALPIAAAVLTVGGALGVPFMAGGFGGTVSRLLGNGLLGKVVTHAGIGGMIGGGIGAITGGKKGFIKGSLYGQAAGVATGAISSYMSPASAASSASAAPAGGAGPGSQPGLSQSTSAMRGYGTDLPGQSSVIPASGAYGGMAPAGAVQSQAAQGITNATYQLPSSGMAQAGGFGAAGAPGYAPFNTAGGFGSWAERNPMATAALITSTGAALPAAIGAMTKGKDDENQGLAIEDARRKAIASNYKGFNSGLTLQPINMTRPTERYVYDPAAGRLVKKMVA